MKKALVGADAKTSISLIIKYFDPLLVVNYAPGAEFFLRPSCVILPPMKLFLPLPLKMESAPDENNPGHASSYLNIFLNIYKDKTILFIIIYYTF